MNAWIWKNQIRRDTPAHLAIWNSTDGRLEWIKKDRVLKETDTAYLVAPALTVSPRANWKYKSNSTPFVSN